MSLKKNYPGTFFLKQIADVLQVPVKGLFDFE